MNFFQIPPPAAAPDELTRIAGFIVTLGTLAYYVIPRLRPGKSSTGEMKTLVGVISDQDKEMDKMKLYVGKLEARLMELGSRYDDLLP